MSTLPARSDASAPVPARSGEAIEFRETRAVRVLIGTVMLALGSIFAFLGGAALVHGFDGPAALPAVFALAGGIALGGGVLLAFGRRTVEIDAARRTVIVASTCLGFGRRREHPFETFDVVGVSYVTDDAFPLHFAELRGAEVDLAVPGTGATPEAALRHAEAIAAATGLPVDDEPRCIRLGLWT